MKSNEKKKAQNKKRKHKQGKKKHLKQQILDEIFSKSKEFSLEYLRSLAKEIEAMETSSPIDSSIEYQKSLAEHTLQIAGSRKLR